MTTAPNTCHANTDATYMSWTQVKGLKNTYGWEIGSHTVTHPYLATYDATDGQPKPLTQTQVIDELKNSKAALAAQGIDAQAFSTPYGDYNNFTLQQIAKYYSSHRGFADQGLNGWPNNDLLLYDFPVQAGVSVATVESKIDQAIANKQWLILTMHNIKTNPSTNPDDYEYSTANLDKIAAYAKSKITAGTLQSTNVTAGLTSGTTGDNLLPNSSFDNGISGGWTTDNPAAVTADSANNGSYPSATNSIKFSPSSAAGRLYSPRVSVNPNTTYVLKDYLSNQSKTGPSTGEMEFYIDEYDVNGNWISGQYKKAEPSVYTEDLNFTYTPTSQAVARADLQITNTAGSGITAYLDNSQWMALATGTPTPPSTGQISQANNLVTGKTFTSSVGVATGSSTAFVNDGNEATAWVSKPYNAVTMTVDLGATTTLTKISTLWAVNATKDYQIKASNDGTNFTTIASGVTNGSASSQLIDTTTFSAPATGRYFRILAVDRWNTTVGNTIYEIGMYNTTSAPPVAQANLIDNGTFDAGLGTWRTDGATNFVADSGSHGSPNNVVNSVRLSAGSTSTHLFSPLVAVSSTKTYDLLSYANLLTLNTTNGGELGFYIDEYDASGNWISGQYMGGMRATGSGNVEFHYTPSSANVASASLQVILVGGSGITGYFDDVRWYAL